MSRQSGRWHDRHSIPAPTAGLDRARTPSGEAPDQDTVDWAGYQNGLNRRIGELFLTLPGLPGHATQVQQELKRINGPVTNGSLEKKIANQLVDELFGAIKKSAQAAALQDFPQQTFTVSSVGRTLTIFKQSGKVIWFN